MTEDADDSELDDINAQIADAETGSNEQRLREAVKQLKIVKADIESSGHQRDLGTAEMLTRGVANDLRDEDADDAITGER